MVRLEVGITQSSLARTCRKAPLPYCTLRSKDRQLGHFEEVAAVAANVVESQSGEEVRSCSDGACWGAATSRRSGWRRRFSRRPTVAWWRFAAETTGGRGRLLTGSAC